MSQKADNDRTVYENCRTRDCPIFCRSGPWTEVNNQGKNVKGRDFEDALMDTLSPDDKEHCTRF